MENFNDIFAAIGVMDQHLRHMPQLPVEVLTKDLENIRLLARKEQHAAVSAQAQSRAAIKVGRAFADRFAVAQDIAHSMTDLIPGCNATITGSFVRQIFELPFALADNCNLSTTGQNIGRYGSPSGHDVDITIFSEPGSATDRENIAKYIARIQSTGLPPKFGDYTLVNITETTIFNAQLTAHDTLGKKCLADIPHYHFYLVNGGESLNVDIIAWQPACDEKWPSGDFDVNTLKINNNGVVCCGFFDVLASIAKRQAKCLIDVGEIARLAMPRDDITIGNRQNLRQLAFYVTNRLKLLAYGYAVSAREIVRAHLDNDDVVTTLECGHEVSSREFARVTSARNIGDFDFKCAACGAPFVVQICTQENTSSSKKWWMQKIAAKWTNRAVPELPEVGSYDWRI